MGSIGAQSAGIGCVREWLQSQGEAREQAAEIPSPGPLYGPTLIEALVFTGHAVDQQAALTHQVEPGGVG